MALPSGLWKVAILEKPADLAQPIGQESRRDQPVALPVGLPTQRDSSVHDHQHRWARPPRRAGSPRAARDPTQVLPQSSTSNPVLPQSDRAA
jgi:hypothetical protein